MKGVGDRATTHFVKEVVVVVRVLGTLVVVP